MNVDQNLVLRHADGAVYRDIAGEALVVPVKGRLADLQSIFSLSPVGGDIWQRLDGVRSIETIIEELCGTYEVDRDAAEADCRAFFRELLDADLAVITGGADG